MSPTKKTKRNIRTRGGMVFILLLSYCFLSFYAKAANIRGRVYDLTTNKPIPAATVSLSFPKQNAVADVNGQYQFTNLKAGTYRVFSWCIGYKKSKPEEVKISSHDTTIILNIYLEGDQINMSEVDVSAKRNKETNASARADEKLAPNVINIISARSIALLPDQNVADVMQRISGVSMTKNSFGSNSHLEIRGMPSRYNSVLVDGCVMPSTSSNGRSVDLNLFGSDLVGRIDVIKGVTPDLEADAIGGTVNIETKEAPDTAFLKIEAGSGYNQYYLNHDFLTFDNSKVSQKDFSELYGPDYLANESEFPRQNLVVKSVKALPNLNLGVSGAKKFLHNKLGVLAAVSLQNTSQANTYNYTSYVPALSNGKPTPEYFENEEYSKRQNSLGGYVKLDYNLNSANKISLLTSLFQQNEQRVREYADHQTENGGEFIRPITTQTETDISTLFNNSLRGNHRLSDNLEVDWTLSYATGESISPDFANVELAQGGNAPPTLNYSRPVVRTWQWNKDQNKSGYINIKYKPEIFKHLFEFKAGGMYRNKTRQNYANEYYFQPYDDTTYRNYKNYPNPDLLTVPLRNNENDQEKKGNAYLNPGNFNAEEDITAAYAMVTTSFGNLYILTGVRFEDTYLYTEHNQNNIQIPVAKALQQYDNLFPSLHLTYKFTEKQNLRFSYYKAINRPTFTEIIPYADPRAATVKGNPNLKPAFGENYDLRYEIYPKPQDVISIGVFYKKIDNAIEDIISADGSTSPRNVPAPTYDYGLELVAYKEIGNFSLSGNYTYNKSIISDKAIDFVYNDTVLVANPVVGYTRTLIGQSANILNLSLSYHNPKYGLKTSVTYTMQGGYLLATNNSHLHFNTYQDTYNDLGLSLEKRFGKRFYVSVKVSNLLNSPITWHMKEENNTLVRKAYDYQMYYLLFKYFI